MRLSSLAIRCAVTAIAAVSLSATVPSAKAATAEAFVNCVRIPSSPTNRSAYNKVTASIDVNWGTSTSAIAEWSVGWHFGNSSTRLDTNFATSPGVHGLPYPGYIKDLPRSAGYYLCEVTVSWGSTILAHDTATELAPAS